MNPWESLEVFKLHQQNEANRKLKQLNDTLARQPSVSSPDTSALNEQKRVLEKQIAVLKSELEDQHKSQKEQTKLIKQQFDQIRKESELDKVAEEQQKVRRNTLYNLKVQFDDIYEQLTSSSGREEGYSSFISLKQSYEQAEGGFSSILNEDLFNLLDYKMLCSEAKKVLKRINPIVKVIGDEKSLYYVQATFSEILQQYEEGRLNEYACERFYETKEKFSFVLVEDSLLEEEHKLICRDLNNQNHNIQQYINEYRQEKASVETKEALSANLAILSDQFQKVHEAIENGATPTHIIHLYETVWPEKGYVNDGFAHLEVLSENSHGTEEEKEHCRSVKSLQSSILSYIASLGEGERKGAGELSWVAEGMTEFFGSFQEKIVCISRTDLDEHGDGIMTIQIRSAKSGLILDQLPQFQRRGKYYLGNLVGLHLGVDGVLHGIIAPEDDGQELTCFSYDISLLKLLKEFSIDWHLDGVVEGITPVSKYMFIHWYKDGEDGEEEGYNLLVIDSHTGAICWHEQYDAEYDGPGRGLIAEGEIFNGIVFPDNTLLSVQDGSKVRNLQNGEVIKNFKKSGSMETVNLLNEFEEEESVFVFESIEAIVCIYKGGSGLPSRIVVFDLNTHEIKLSCMVPRSGLEPFLDPDHTAMYGTYSNRSREFPSPPDSLIKIDLKTGEILWNTEIATDTPAYVCSDKMILTFSFNKVFAYNKETGEKIFEREFEKGTEPNVVLGNAGIAYTNMCGKIIAIDTSSGEIKWEYQTASDFLDEESLRLLEDGTLLVTGYDGKYKKGPSVGYAIQTESNRVVHDYANNAWDLDRLIMINERTGSFH
jgi:hypothetical protein